MPILLPILGPEVSLHVTQSSTLDVPKLSVRCLDGELIILSSLTQCLVKSNCQKLPFVLNCNEPIKLAL